MKFTALAMTALAIAGHLTGGSGRVSSGAGQSVHNDFDGDGRADLLWHNSVSGANVAWLSGNSTTTLAVPSVVFPGYRHELVATGAFNKDRRTDFLWVEKATGDPAIAILSGTSGLGYMYTEPMAPGWLPAGVGDFNGNGSDDILWRNNQQGTNLIWFADSLQFKLLTSVNNPDWRIVGVGDFDGDGVSDILWRNATSGSNAIWRSANSQTTQAITGVANLSWKVAGIGDFNADGVSDIFWRNTSTGANAIWKSANYATQQPVSSASLPWTVGSIADFNGDGQSDVLWRNATTGANVIWRSASSGDRQPLTSMANPAWSTLK